MRDEAKKKVAREEYKRRHKELGLCIFCPRPAAGKKYCAMHLEKHRKYRPPGWRSKYTAKYRLEHRCISCSAPLDPDADMGHAKCINCREGSNETIAI